MRLFRPVWKGKDGQRRRSKTWWIDFATANKLRHRLPGLADRRATEGLARRVGELLAVRQSGDPLPADLLKWLEETPADFRERLAAAGLIDADRAGGLKVLVETDAENKIVGGHLADFIADAKARNVSPVQVHMLGQRIRDVLSRAGCRWLRDLSAARVQAAIAALGEPVDDAPGLSRQSQTHYVRAIRQFSRWLQREGRTAADCLIGLRSYNAETDKRHERRGFTADEMAVLVSFTATAPTRWGMSGASRAAAYRLAFASGLRRNEIRTLTAARFRLDADPPVVVVEAGYSKHRRTDTQPLPADVADVLAAYLATADPARPFPLPHKTGRMLREDMAGARAKWIADAANEGERQDRADDPDFLMPVDGAGLHLDFHSTRHAYVSAICKAAVSPRVMMQLSRHSDPRLTMKRYSRLATADTVTALDALPKLAAPDADRQALRATGTDNATAAQNAAGSRQSDDPGQGRPSGPGGFRDCPQRRQRSGRASWRTRRRIDRRE